MKKEYDLSKLKKREKPLNVDNGAAKVPISLRIDGSVLAQLKSEAKTRGLPYQTFISSILFQFANGELIEKRIVKILKEIKAS